MSIICRNCSRLHTRRIKSSEENFSGTRLVVMVMQHDNNVIHCTKRFQTFVMMQLRSSRGCSLNADPCCQVPSGNYPANGEMIPFSVPGHGVSNYGVVGTSASDQCRSPGLGSFSPNWKRLIFYACFMPQPFSFECKATFAVHRWSVLERLSLSQRGLFGCSILYFVLLKTLPQEHVYWTKLILIMTGTVYEGNNSTYLDVQTIGVMQQINLCVILILSWLRRPAFRSCGYLTIFTLSPSGLKTLTC